MSTTRPGVSTQRERELAAADRIFALLPEDQGQQMRALWDEFEARETPEAKFARSLDCIQPTMLNDASQGKSWLEHGIHLSQVLRRNQRTGEGLPGAVGLCPHPLCGAPPGEGIGGGLRQSATRPALA